MIFELVCTVGRSVRDVIGKTVLRRIDESRQEHPERENH
jgi:hypothetical protein